MNVRLRMYKYCYSNLGTTYAKGLFHVATWFILQNIETVVESRATCFHVVRFVHKERKFHLNQCVLVIVEYHQCCS